MKSDNRWVKTLLLSIAVVAFAGSMVVLPFAGAFQNRTSNATPADAGNAANTRQSELEAQARGYELVLEREPDNTTALEGLLEVRLEMQDIEGAIAPLERLVELNPDQTDYAVLLAQAKQQVGDREGSAQVYREVLSTQPGNMNALQGLVALMIEEERPEAAVGLLEDTLQLADEANQLQPGSVDVVAVQLLLGRVFAETDRFDEALSVYDEAIARDALDFRPVLAKAIILQTLERNNEARPLFEQAAAMAPAQFKDQINQIAAGNAPESQEAPADLPTPDTEATETPETSAPGTETPDETPGNETPNSEPPATDAAE